MQQRKIILKTFLSPGDLCTLTAAIESLHASYPGQFLTDVRTSCDELFRHNPRITSLDPNDAGVLEMHYTDLINRCDDVPNPFLRGYCYDLGKQLGVPLELTTNRPHLYLSDAERLADPFEGFGTRPRRPFWLVNAGIKRDFTLKQWPVEYYQDVVDSLEDRIDFVQVGSRDHDHPDLERVINLIGRTSIRQLMCLVSTAAGGLGPITFLQHLCAGFEKPYVALLGGREPVTWTQYPLQTTLHTLGMLPCCRTRSCWRSRVVRLNDGCEGDKNLCESPVLSLERPVGKCMFSIKPDRVVSAIEGYCGLTERISDPASRQTSVAEKSGGSESAAPICDQSLALKAHSAWGFEVKIVPAMRGRDWMDAIPHGFAYHCLPMVLANQSGWLILAPHGVIAEWNGRPGMADLRVAATGSPTVMHAESHVGHGILTWKIPYVFRTPPGWNLLCRGPANCVKDGICPLEGLVETDWTFASFSMNWKFSRPGRVEFTAGESIAMLVPQRRGDLEAFAPRYAELLEDPELAAGYDVWVKSRHEFWRALERGDPEATRARYQKHYYRGRTNDGRQFAPHQKWRELAPFSPQALRGEPGSNRSPE